ncbi:gephyrin-like molybdotransferase Glp [Alteribacillus sp. HJP-4]|uniref:molybdopterin molybdotransferase MoeA n=1 Tax=Alteribacillus sp. HJP-4 TaxID=2775394 RepID=UPI0035CD0E49
MVEKRDPIPVAQAVEAVIKQAAPGAATQINIKDAPGQFLAEDIIADHDVPGFDRSPYDGFAIRAEDSAGAANENPLTFSVIGEIGAGSVFEKPVGSMEAVRIMTGAKIPEDCDAVVMLELVQEKHDHGQPLFELKRSFQSGDNISKQGEDTTKGSVLVEKGSKINPGVSALLATFGYDRVKVTKKPVVGVIATGSELLEAGEALQPGKIRNSNAYMVMAQIERAGAEGRYFGKFNDELESCFAITKEALRDVDILITTGGVSVGDYDYIPAILDKLKAEVYCNKIAMRPGSVTTIAKADGKMIYGLSGNPSACYVGFELFARPFIRRVLGQTRPHLRKAKALLGADFKKANPFTRFVRSKVEYEGDKLVAYPSGLDKSGVVTSLASADILTVLPGGTRGYKKGMMVDVLLLEDNQGSEWPWNDIVPSYR